MNSIPAFIRHDPALRTLHAPATPLALIWTRPGAHRESSAHEDRQHGQHGRAKYSSQEAYGNISNHVNNLRRMSTDELRESSRNVRPTTRHGRRKVAGGAVQNGVASQTARQAVNFAPEVSNRQDSHRLQRLRHRSASSGLEREALQFRPHRACPPHPWRKQVADQNKNHPAPI